MIKKIDPKEYLEELYEVQVKAFEAYPKKYRPTVNHDEFINNLKTCKNTFLGAFSKDDNQKLCGYTQSSCRDICIDFSVLKTIPQYEKLGLNAALVYGLLEYYKDDIASGKYICDGSRSINHETHFQDYLEKYFGFRKAYCKLHIKYRFWIFVPIKIMYCFRNQLKKFDNISIFHLINSVLTMEEIRRKCKKSDK